MSHYSPQHKIGYLGGGQLAQMLSESAHQMGLSPYVLSENKTDPAAGVTSNSMQGSLKNEADLVNFLKQVNVATFESEFLDAALLIKAKKQAGTEIYPTPELMGLLQDRKTQKDLFDQYKLPTSPWTCVDTIEEVEEYLAQYKLPVVFKKRFFGYDGYGTFVVKNKKQLNEFYKNDFKPHLFIVEKFIPFKKECAVILARSLDASFTHLPFVESFQRDSRCDWIKGPIKLKASKDMLKALRNFLKKIQYVGVMGVEFFVTSKGLIINEIAPRVHNTGHYSQETPGPSQFDLHNMCLLGQKLPKEINLGKGFAMANLIGEGGKVDLKQTGGLHWYNKLDNRKGRKMGHINALGSSPDEALKLALKKRKGVRL